jgi:cytochrome oxidase Cu insertion factor (SCO1/SenC/PrrC family)
MNWLAILRKIQWGLVAVLLATLGGIAVWSWQAGTSKQGGWEEKPLEGLKVYGTVSGFSLIDQRGHQISLSEFKGKIWVADFIYTNCQDTCPVQSARMRLIQDEFAKEKDLRLVSITVDPDRDTPEVLTEYAKRFGASSDRWLFLTGEKDQLYRLTQEGFRLSAVPVSSDENANRIIAHSSRFVLVDSEARIRGYYPGTDADAVARLHSDLKALLSEKLTS